MRTSRFISILAVAGLLLSLGSVAVFARGPAEPTGEAAGSEAATAEQWSGTTWGWTSPAEFKAATGQTLPAYKQSPVLDARVASGELQPVAQRLPKEPLVERPFEGIGSYGGTLRLGAANQFLWAPASLHTTLEYLLILDPTATEVIPNLAMGWEFSSDFKTLTLHLREGTRWSDGEPFTADDIMFVWEGVILNDELTPVKPNQWKPNGQLMQVTKVDTYTVRYSFAVPYPAVLWHFAGIGFSGSQMNAYLPMHVLSKYHIDYNPKANDLAVEAGMEFWWQLFNQKRDHLLGKNVLPDEIPTMGPWIVKEVVPEGISYVRNPYYFKVDPQGNQLPYIDNVKATFFGDDQTKALKVIAGEYDYIEWFTSPVDYPVFQENAEEGGYLVWLAKSFKGSMDCSPIFNQNYTEDPAVGVILQDVRFRQAMSLAINRDEFNDLFFFGRGVPRQSTVVPEASFYKEEWGSTYTQYDPAAANRLLDQMGLDKRDKDGFRLRPDGKTLNIIYAHLNEVNPPQWSELVKEYWEDVGVRVTINPMDRSYLNELSASGGLQVYEFAFNDAALFPLAAGSNVILRGEGWGPQWRSWWNSKGESGVEPPKDVQRMWELFDRIPQLAGEPQKAAFTEMFDIWARNLFHVGIVGLSPTTAVTSLKLMNVNYDTYGGAPDTGLGTFNRLYQSSFR